MHVPGLLFDEKTRTFRDDCAVVFESDGHGRSSCRTVFMDPEETTHRKLEREVERLREDRAEMWRWFGRRRSDA